MERILTIITRTVCLGVAGILLLFLVGTANATGGDDHGCGKHHTHPECDITGPPGADGKDGKDGKDGRDGIDGIDGKDGRDGIDGINGIDGKDGVVDETWIYETRNNFKSWRHYSAASNSIQIHLPQERGSRLTLGGSTFDGTTGLGLGYAYKMDRDDNLSFTAGIGTSGGEQVGVVSVGFEFGTDRIVEPYSYDDSRLERRLAELEQRFSRQQEQAAQCAGELVREERTRADEKVEKAFMKCLQK